MYKSAHYNSIAFIQSSTPTNNIEKTGEFVPTTVLEPLMGTRVSMRGNTTQAVSSGYITNTNATVRLTMPDKSVITFSNLARAGYSGALGNNGGIVFSSGTATYGIHEGGRNCVSYFIKAWHSMKCVSFHYLCTVIYMYNETVNCVFDNNHTFYCVLCLSTKQER